MDEGTKRELVWALVFGVIIVGIPRACSEDETSSDTEVERAPAVKSIPRADSLRAGNEISEDLRDVADSIMRDVADSIRREREKR